MSSPEFSAVTESIANLSLVTTDAPPQDEDERSEETLTPRQAHFPPEEQAPETSSRRRHGRKTRKQSQSGSETETEDHNNMPSGSSSKHHHHHSSSSTKKHGSSSKHQSKGDDWSEVTEPEERRRIQNRIAQRKFREKAREQKEREERESRNEQLAGSSYQVPVPSDFASAGGEYDDYLSGVPWGGVSIQHMVAMGHESESRRGSRRGGGLSDHQQQQQYDYGAFYDPQLYDGQLAGGYGGGDNNRYFDALSASGSSPSYLSFDSGSGYDNFSGDNSSSSGTRY
ncbi:hypothetical protein N8I77_008708 [Diaporthe amygdali]|uniref:BZIP domain-containing protein n=1 Tax=Phomopsis amygdali TaxID=1214568 RepID=A0AAD9W2G7_PHOAM|nr:hypothetical protein N8I77_008708 [Diaporthe amygdali]